MSIDLSLKASFVHYLRKTLTSICICLLIIGCSVANQPSNSNLSDDARSIEPEPTKPQQNDLNNLVKQEKIAALKKALSRMEDSRKGLPRRKSINASTKEYQYAAYLDRWQRKIETFANRNYPQHIKQKKLYGSLVLHVAIMTDGSVERVRVLNSSGHELLDKAAVSIVHMAEPYEPFPKGIRQEVEILDIVRIWKFQPGREAAN